MTPAPAWHARATHLYLGKLAGMRTDTVNC